MRKIAVTGGGGFVGKALVKLAVKNNIECIVVGRNSYPDLEKLGVRCEQGDIRDRSFLCRAVEGVDTVFHVAALAGIWGPWQDYYSINVQGTENVIHACLQNTIPSLVYTSTPSVVFNRKSIEGGDERLPYAEKFLCNYARSKVMAERLVLEANVEGLGTCAIRPHLVWGPEDPHLIPRLLEKGRRRELKQVGDGSNLVDISYVDTVAHAHFLAGKNLHGPGSARGKSYFVSQDEPVRLWTWINGLFERVGIEPVRGTVPFPAAYAVGVILEAVHSLLKRGVEPRMTRFLAEQLAKSHYFDLTNIKKDLGYEPLISTGEGMNRLVEWIVTHEK